MKDYLKKLIKETVEAVFETQERKYKIIKAIQDSILNSEIGYRTLEPGLQPFAANEREIKSEINSRILKNIRALQNISHTADDKNKLIHKSGIGNPIKDKSEFAFNANTMYLYKLGTFNALQFEDYKKVYFKKDSLPNIVPSSTAFGIDSLFVIIYKDTFYDFAFYSSMDADENLNKYMKSVFMKNAESKKETFPTSYEISGIYNEDFKLITGKTLQPREEPEKRALKLKGFKVSGLVFVPSYGWGMISSIKNPYVMVKFPKNREDKIFNTPERPVLVKKSGDKVLLTKEKFPIYMNKVGEETKKFDGQKLFMQALVAEDTSPLDI